MEIYLGVWFWEHSLLFASSQVAEFPTIWNGPNNFHRVFQEESWCVLKDLEQHPILIYWYFSQLYLFYKLRPLPLSGVISDPLLLDTIPGSEKGSHLNHLTISEVNLFQHTILTGQGFRSIHYPFDCYF